MSTIWIGGIHALRQALNDGNLLRLEVSEGKTSKNLASLVADAKAAQIEIITVPRHYIDHRLPDVRHQGIAGECRLSAQASNWQQAISGVERPFILVLDSIQDPHNLGACLRTAMAAGVDAVVLPNSCAADITPVVRKIACGAAEALAIFRVANLKREVEMMKEKGLWVVGGAGEAEKSLFDLDLSGGLVMIVGNEEKGIHYGLRQTCDWLAAIPMAETMESLNVSVACGIMLFEARRQRLMH
ncbi:23S rRNA (guanosine(2251)-2'-O)-methyltransferase RlmB [Dichelobacter nodosus]|uniref:RNA methyltransferase, TrmH family, group 3 n=1 Tax=Dichelobacter nodosus (strain VCS1703A) TaxID=246195 RepID=A5EVE3_DICNV|nr:23S rRNA (guanosine(2251)-2'-O)-methyltransferase RlmB [Dichelobacter nodosus]ABQ13521.1 RNA methyltransferase, TrmH family, group 3 [Dichelobacter nodosus VCS1703A]AXM45473.1 23S rRNA (guanosine(2251)-2'-O)-methyltransferase RlmB [Dichelobacter nodosus]KNZ39841.1 RNA methyltransferase [Dichelobacter nodosus]TGA66667.1 23S rRNA (guanosine(2251)-2'-O)-methyltransferase RlmB [Dichelobacter nodosus]